MCLKSYKCMGYHGTSTTSGHLIMNSGKFNNSSKEEEWLGTGVYFFEEDEQQAINFISKARGQKEYIILKANIDSEKLLDLMDLTTYKQFEQIAKNMQNRYQKRKDNKPRELMNSVILNAMYKLKPYEVVRCVFSVPSTLQAPRTNIGPTQIQICVKEHNCISQIEEVC